jgi:hypothetical protein
MAYHEDVVGSVSDKMPRILIDGMHIVQRSLTPP